MELHRNTSDKLNVVTAFGDDGLRVGIINLTQSCIVTPTQVLDRWPVTCVGTLTAADFETVVALQPEIVILGTGAHLEFPPSQPGLSLTQRGIGFEFMDTAAACRTYNVLVHEGRNVAAALILTPSRASTSVE